MLWYQPQVEGILFDITLLLFIHHFPPFICYTFSFLQIQIQEIQFDIKLLHLEKGLLTKDLKYYLYKADFAVGDRAVEICIYFHKQLHRLQIH